MLYDLSGSDNSWYLGGAMLLSQKGYKVDNVFFPKSETENVLIETRVNTTALEIPVLVGKNFSLGGNNKLFVEAGPYVTCSLWGSQQVKSEGKKNTTHDIFGKGGLKRFDCGLTFGVGADISNRVRVKCNYEFGFPNLVDNDKKLPGTKGSSYKNSTISTTLSYTF